MHVPEPLPTPDPMCASNALTFSACQCRCQRLAIGARDPVGTGLGWLCLGGKLGFGMALLCSPQPEKAREGLDSVGTVFVNISGIVSVEDRLEMRLRLVEKCQDPHRRSTKR